MAASPWPCGVRGRLPPRYTVVPDDVSKLNGQSIVLAIGLVDRHMSLHECSRSGYMYARSQCFGTTLVGDYREEIDRSDRRYLLPALSPPILTRVPPAVYRSRSGMTGLRVVPGRPARQCLGWSGACGWGGQWLSGHGFTSLERGGQKLSASYSFNLHRPSAKHDPVGFLF